MRDLLFHYPRRYVDYTRPYAVAEAPYDVDCCVRAEVLQKEPPRRIKGGRVLTRVLAADDSGTLTLSWFNAPYVAEHLEIGQSYYFEGRVGGSLTRREILHPAIRTQADVAAAPLVPVYPSTEGLPSGRIARAAAAALDAADDLPDPLPAFLLTRYRMPSRAAAIRAIHAPKSAEDAAAARRRLILRNCMFCSWASSCCGGTAGSRPARRCTRWTFRPSGAVCPMRPQTPSAAPPGRSAATFAAGCP